MGLPSTSTSLIAAEQKEAQAYLAAVDQEAMMRVTMSYVMSTVSRLNWARQSNPTGPVTRSQLNEHGTILALAVKHSFIRYSGLWGEYMASQVGQALEDERWQAEYEQKEKGKNMLMVEQGEATGTWLPSSIQVNAP